VKILSATNLLFILFAALAAALAGCCLFLHMGFLARLTQLQIIKRDSRSHTYSGASPDAAKNKPTSLLIAAMITTHRPLRQISIPQLHTFPCITLWHSKCFKAIVIRENVAQSGRIAANIEAVLT
jgi:hypothetical protein